MLLSNWQYLCCLFQTDTSIFWLREHCQFLFPCLDAVGTTVSELLANLQQIDNLNGLRKYGIEQGLLEYAASHLLTIQSIVFGDTGK